MSAHTSSSHIEVPFSGKIHQVLNSDSGDHLLIQVNDSEHSSSFHLLALSSSEIAKSWYATPDTPNLSVRSFNEQKFVAISFSQIQNPDLIDIHVYDWNKSDPIYLFQNTKLLAVEGEILEIKHAQIENRIVQIDLQSGQEIRNKTSLKSNKPESAQFPVSYDQSNEYFSWFAKLLSRFGFEPKLQCEHLESNGSHMISFYVDNKGSLLNYIVLIDETGNLREKCILASDLKGIGKDTFFVIKNRVIFVSNYNTLNVLHL